MKKTLAPVRLHFSRSSRRGQVLVITILGLTLLAGLVFYTFNVGLEINRRRDLQDAADAAALGGAHWLGRGMNLIAAGNFGQAKALGMIPILDSMPQASRMSRYELERWHQSVAMQLDRPMFFTGDRIVREALENLQARLRLQLEVITPWDERLNAGGLDMSQITEYRTGRGGPAPQGRLWQAALAMDELSQVSAFLAGYFAQLAADHWARVNGAEAGLLVPILPEIPYRRGSYSDFRYPLKGKMTVTSTEMAIANDPGSGGAIPDAQYPHRLGPYARLQRWRDYLRRATGWEYVPGSGTPPRQSGGQGFLTGGRRTGSSVQTPSFGGQRGRWRATGWEVYGYRPRGPYIQAMRHINFMDRGTWERLVDETRVGQDTYFGSYLWQLSRAKLEHVLGDENPRYIHVPQWERMDYPQARAHAENNPVHQTLFYVVEVVSRDKPLGNFGPEGSYRTNANFPVSIWANGWEDPEQWNVAKVANHIWMQQYSYRVTYDSELGLEPRYDPLTDEPIWYELWMTRFYVFGGIDTGRQEEISNPANYEEGDPLPAPTLIDPRDGDLDPDDPHNLDNPFRRNYFTVLAMVRRPGQQETWTRRFGNASPSGSVHALAQAQVFNASSWDFWTQDWQAKLTPLTGWQDWVEKMEAGRDDLDAMAGQFDAEELDRALRYLRALGPDLVQHYRSQ